MPPKNRSSLTLEQRKIVLSEREIAEHIVLFFFSWGIVINKRNYTVLTVNNAIL